MTVEVNGASNMMEKHSDVSIKISEEQPKVIATHGQGHSLSLAAKSLTKNVLFCETLWEQLEKFAP